MAGKQINKYIAVLLVFTMVFSMTVSSGVWAEPGDTGDAERTVPEAVYEEVYADVTGLMRFAAASYMPASAVSFISDAAAVEMVCQAIEEADKAGAFTGLIVGDAGDDWQREMALQAAASAEVKAAVTGLGVGLYAWINGTDYCIDIFKNNEYIEYTVEDISFMEDSDVDALDLLKVVIASDNYRELQVEDLGSQAQKTTAVQDIVDNWLWEVDAEAVVTFDGTNYEAAISMDRTDSCTITDVSFVLSDAVIMNGIEAAISAADEAGSFQNLEVGDAEDEWQRTAAVRLAVGAVVETVISGVEMYIDAALDSGNDYWINIYKNDEWCEYLIEGVTFTEIPDADAGAVNLAKKVIASINYTALGVVDTADQGQKTGAIQAEVDERLEGSGVTASVDWDEDSSGYVVGIAKNSTSDSYIITTATFIKSSYAVMMAAYSAIEAASFENLLVGDTGNATQKRAAVRFAALEAAAGFGVDIGVWPIGAGYIISIRKNNEEEDYELSTATFEASDAGAVELAKKVIVAENYKGLEVCYNASQEQKTAAVQSVVDQALDGFGIEAAVVTFADPDYTVAVSMNEENDSYVIPGGDVSFRVTDSGIAFAAKEAIEAAYEADAFTDLEVADAEDQWQMETVVRLTVEALVAEYGVDIYLYYDSSGSRFQLNINRNSDSESLWIGVYKESELKISFVETDTGAVRMAKEAVKEAEAGGRDEPAFENLQVGDMNNQGQKTAAVQAAVDEVLADYDVVASVVFDNPYYAVELYMNDAYESHTITRASFGLYAPLAVAAAKKAIEAVDYTRLKTHPVNTGYEYDSIKIAAIQEAASNAADGLNVDIWVTKIKNVQNVYDFRINISCDDEEDSHTITGITFEQDDDLAIAEVLNAVRTAGYADLPVDDIDCQWKKTASVKAAVNAAVNNIWAMSVEEATVEFDGNNYIAEIIVGSANDSYTIPGGSVSFEESDLGTIIAANYFIKAASFENLELSAADITDQAKKTAAVQAAVNSALEAADLKRTGLTAEVSVEYSYYYYINYTINELVRNRWDSISPSFIVSNAAEEAKTAIAAADYTDLEIADPDSQDQKTAAVQNAVDTALRFMPGVGNVTTEVEFDDPDYLVSIYTDGTFRDSHTITPDKVSFVVTDDAIIDELNNTMEKVILETDYTELEVLDMDDQLQKTAAVQAAVEEAVEAVVEGRGFTIETIFYGDEYVTFVEGDELYTGCFIDTAAFIESGTCAVKLAKGIISMASYTDLEVADAVYQEQKTAAVNIVVQAALDRIPALSDVTTEVTFDGTNYIAAISHDGINSDKTIYLATFIESDEGAVKLAKAAAESADYNNLVVDDTTDQGQRTAAVEAVVSEATAGLGVDIYVTYTAGYYRVDISKNAASGSCYIDKASFVPPAASAVGAAGTAIAAASFRYLTVMDVNNQDQKTSAVKAVVDEVLTGFGVTAVVTFNGAEYEARVSNGMDEATYTITTATFVQSNQLVLIAAKAAIAAANYANLPVGDIIYQEQKTAAIRSAAEAAAAGYGVTVTAAFNGTGYTVTIVKNTAQSSYTITNATFYPTNNYTITTAPAAGGTATVAVSNASAYAGDTITVDITYIQAGMRLSSITVNDGAVPVTQVTEGTEYTFIMPAGAVTVAVTLENIPRYVADITDNNIIIVGRHAFNLDTAVQAVLAADKKYNQSNFLEAISSWIHEPQSGVKAIYYRAGNNWYNLTAAEGQGLVPEAGVSANEVNGDGIYYYMNMDLLP